MSKSSKLRTAALPSSTDKNLIDQPLQEYVSLLEAVPWGFVLVDKLGFVETCNSAGRSLFNYRNIDIVGIECTALLRESDRDLFVDYLQRSMQVVITPAKCINLQLEGMRKDGSTFPVEIHMKTCYLAGRELVGCSFRDISRRRHNEALHRYAQERLEEKNASLIETESRLRLAQESGGVACWEWDLNLAITYCSDNLVALYGIDSLEKIRTFDGWLTTLHPDDRERVTRVLRAGMINVEQQISMEYRTIWPDDSIHWLFMRATLIVDDDSNPWRLTGTTFDITTKKFVEEELKESEERFKSAFNQSVVPMLLVSRDGIFRVNAAMCDLMGYAENELLTMELVDLVHPEDRDRAIIQRDKIISGSINQYSSESRYLTCSEEIKWVLVNVVSVKDRQGDFNYAIIQLQDNTEEHVLSNRLSHEATHDSLTGLANRREFENRLATVLETIKSEKTENALVYIDLDQFKVINDTCGHAAGDELLTQVAGMMSGNLRKDDLIARLGGDEFGVFMEHCNLQQARVVIGKIHKLVSEFRFIWEDKSFNVGMSCGLVAITEESRDVIEILKQADAACYAAKDAGRNRLHVYHSQDKALSRRNGEMQWVARINKALLEDRFTLYCQPIAAVGIEGTGRLYYEVLLRLQEENGNLVPPGAFLPAAERYGLSVHIDKWVIEKTLKWLDDHPSHVEKLDLCCINLSGLSLGDQDLLDFIEKEFEKNEIPAEKICFEITETAAITNLGNATRFIKSLKQHGCLFALDDFGSGLSSFTYLKSLEVDILKIDGSFVRDIVTDPVDLAMVRSINEIGKVLGKRTTAEFVENNEILAILRDIGVDRAQGYGISRPIPLEELGQFGR